MFRQAVFNLAKGSNKEKQEMNDNEYRNALKSLDKNKK